MLRRVAAASGLCGRLTAITVAKGVCAPLVPQARYATTDAAATSSIGNNGTFNRGRNSNAAAASARARGRRAALPPAFDIVHWSDEDASKGHLLRVLHRDGFIVLDYHRQKHVAGAVEETGAAGGRRENRAERVVTVTLPPVYVARFLGVLEGRMEKVEVQSRFTNASFVPDTGRGPHHYTLHCTSMKPTTGQSQTIDGADVHEETVEWTVPLDAAESLMLHRFLTQALHFNSGFGRNT